MSLLDWIRRLSYQPVVVRILRILRINLLLRDVYCRLAWQKKKIKHLSFGDIRVQFYVNTPVALRIIEAPLEKGMGERYVLEKLFQALSAGEVVYDIGASLGTHSILMAKRVGGDGTVIAFEPEARSCEILKANIDLNNLKNITPLQMALGDSFGEGVLYSYGGGFGSFNLTGHGKGKSEKIKIVPGDLLVHKKNLPLPNVVKIDVEGYEYAVIKGLKKTLSDETCKMVCCEIHPMLLPEGIIATDVIDLLKLYGFARIETQVRGTTLFAFCSKT